MFEAKLAQAGVLKKIVEAIKDLVTDAPFDCGENALCLQSMDGSHVALVSLKLGTTLFDIYRCDRSLNLGLSLASMSRALKCANNDDSCMLRYDEDEGDNVSFTFEDPKHKMKQTTVVKLMDIDAEHLGVPDQKYSCLVEMSSNRFSKIIKDLAQFSDTVVISCSKGSIQFKANGEGGSHTVECTQGEDDEDEADDKVTVTVQEPVKSSFSVKYLSMFAKASTISPRVRLSLTSAVPIAVEYQIEEDGHLKFYLAPKIDEDQEMD